MPGRANRKCKYSAKYAKQYANNANKHAYTKTLQIQLYITYIIRL